MLKRAWTVLSLSWVGFCLWGFNDSGEIHHLTLENKLMMLAPFIIRLVVLFVVYGIPRSTTVLPRSPR